METITLTDTFPCELLAYNWHDLQSEAISRRDSTSWSGTPFSCRNRRTSPRRAHQHAALAPRRQVRRSAVSHPGGRFCKNSGTII